MTLSVIPATEGLAALASPPVNVSGVDDDEALVELWLHGRPPTTVRAYRHDARLLLDLLHSRGTGLRFATLADVRDHVVSLRGAASTRARRVSSLKSLLRFAQMTGYAPFDVGRAVRPPRVESHLRERICDEEEVLRLLAAARPGRDRTLVRLLYVAGLRVAEACTLRWRHVHPREDGRGQLTVHGKGTRTRHVLVTARLFTELLQLRGTAGDDEHVFLSRSRRPLSVRDAARIVRKVAKAAGISKPISPHWLRHAHASHALNRGAPIHLVQADLGHASVATTSRYLHARPDAGSATYLPE